MSLKKKKKLKKLILILPLPRGDALLIYPGCGRPSGLLSVRMKRKTSSSWCSLIYPCTSNKSISNLRNRKPDGPSTTHRGQDPLRASSATVTLAHAASPLKAYTFNKQLNEWLKGTNKLLRLCSNQCLCFHLHQRPHSVWYAAPHTLIRVRYR